MVKWRQRRRAATYVLLRDICTCALITIHQRAGHRKLAEVTDRIYRNEFDHGRRKRQNAEAYIPAQGYDYGCFSLIYIATPAAFRVLVTYHLPPANLSLCHHGYTNYIFFSCIYEKIWITEFDTNSILYTAKHNSNSILTRLIQYLTKPIYVSNTPVIVPDYYHS